jgi:glycosyltransferase involved in cell wall biosynthesis
VRISFVTGVCIEHDAISNCVHDQYLWLSQAYPNSKIVVYSHASERGANGKSYSGLKDLLLDRHVFESDLVIFHYGLYSELFNINLIFPKAVKRLFWFHNITPAEFVPVENHDLIQKSLRQIHHLQGSDSVVCDSEENERFLRTKGFGSDIKVIPVPYSTPNEKIPQKKSALDQITRLLFLGRIVSSKGVKDLLTVVESLADAGARLNLTMIGNERLSDPQLVSEVKIALQKLDLVEGIECKLLLDATEEQKNIALSEADVFCLPSYHEGFCVPILEALAHGCRVLTYNNSNLRFIGGSLIDRVETGSVAELESRLKAILSDIASARWRSHAFQEYCDDSVRYLRPFDTEMVRQNFLSEIRSLLP